jgi:glycosyltransferase involved in cell wall biosynthesis
MRIVVAAPVEESVPPSKYGGTELVVANLCEGLVKRGHEVFLLASGDSQTSAQLIPIVPKSLRNTYGPSEIDTWRPVIKIEQLAITLREVNRLEPDVVYNHQGWRLAPFLDFIHCPVFTTIHGALNTGSEQYIYHRYPQTPLISISNNQRRALPDLNWVKTVYNGIQMERFAGYLDTERTYFAFLGRTSPEKGLKEICQMIKKTDHQLKIAAKVDTVDRAYFESEIKPLIDGEQIEFIGEIDAEQKSEFLGHAKGLLLWLNWEEPFGLVVAEAMACGTPPIVNPRGSMPELIVNKQTGFLVKSMEEMQEQLDHVGEISPAACREHVQKNFSVEKMTQGYLQLAG